MHFPLHDFLKHSLSCSDDYSTKFIPCLNTSLTFEPPGADSSFPAPDGSDCLSRRTQSRAGAGRLLLLQAYHKTLQHHREASAEKPSTLLVDGPRKIDRG